MVVRAEIHVASAAFSHIAGNRSAAARVFAAVLPRARQQGVWPALADAQLLWIVARGGSKAEAAQPVDITPGCASPVALPSLLLAAHRWHSLSALDEEELPTTPIGPTPAALLQLSRGGVESCELGDGPRRDGFSDRS